jgi:hypothetical protein
MEAARGQTDARDEGATRAVSGSSAGSRDVTIGLGVLGVCALAAIVLGILSSSL